MADTLTRDPYKTFRFIIKFDGAAVAGMNSVSALTKTTEATEDLLTQPDRL